MKRVIEGILVSSVVVWCGTLLSPQDALAQNDEGDVLFNQVCVACHTIGGGKLIGPDLANVQQRRPREWLLRFIKSSKSVIDSGDPYAVARFEEFNNIPMPDNNFSDAQIMNILGYIAANSPGGGVDDKTAQGDAEPDLFSQPATEENVRSGEALFVGTKRLANRGPTCISCHNIKYDGAMSGGGLAKDLTDSHSRLSGAGVTGMIRSSPYPVMKQAFEDTPITDQELFDLTAFLAHVDTESDSQKGRDYFGRMLLSGLGGAVLLFGLLSGAWFRTKKRSVNHAIYERQVKSTWEP